jgi:hypothetical protein
MASPSSVPPSRYATLSTNPQSELAAEALDDLDKISLREILDQDSRPTFVIDLDPDYARGHDIQPVFCNEALRSHDKLLDSVTGAIDENTANKTLGGTTTYDDFRVWATGVSRHNDSKDVFPLALHYQALLWTGLTIRQRWRVISGNALFQTSDIPKGNLQSVSCSKPGTPRKNLKTPDPIKELASAATIPTNEIPPAVAQRSENASLSLSKHISKDTSGSSSSGKSRSASCVWCGH